MVVGEMPEAADFVVVGAGPGGYTAALEAAARGRTVTLVDRSGADGVGGVCLLEGCIPSKALIELANALHHEARRRAMGITPSVDAPESASADASVDLRIFQEWKRELIGTLGDGVRGRLRAAGVTIVKGVAAFTGPRSVRIEHDDGPSGILEFNHAIVATGSRAVRLTALAGDPRVVDAAGVLALEALPASVVVVGGGYVGVELGTALQKLGARVTLLELGSALLGPLGSEVGAEVLTGLTNLGVQVLLDCWVDGSDPRGVHFTRSDGETGIADADLIVVAVGRTPSTDGLETGRAGIGLTPSGHISVDGSLLATDRIAAIGDGIAGPSLAHKATAEASVAVAALCGDRRRWDQLVPQVVFSDPEAASVGLSRKQAQDLGYDAREIRSPFALLGKAHILHEPTGRHRIVYDGASGILLGGSITGTGATELIAELTLAIESGLLIDDLRGTIHPHPTLSEIVTEGRAASATVRART